MFWKLAILILAACRASSSLNLSRSTGPCQEDIGGRYRTVAYYVNWAIYKRQFFPQELPTDKLTHVLYAFANINPHTGEVYLSDLWADTEVILGGDSLDSTGNILHGCLEQLYYLKKKNRNLKVLLSIGGATYSSNFGQPAATLSGRSTFASSAVSLVQKLGLDGIDINWENIAGDDQAKDFLSLLHAVRMALDTYGTSLSPRYNFTLTVACPAGPSNHQMLYLREMDQYIDFWNLMAYDYAGAWSTTTSHQANLFYVDTKSTPFSTQSAVEYYLSQNIPGSKIVLGMPVYGRAFEHSKAVGTSFSGVGNGTWEAGVYDFKALPLSDAFETFDDKSGASYSYDSTKEEFISYDNVEAAKRKAAWIRQLGLGGAMWWEASADRQGNNSLIQNVVAVFGTGGGHGLQNSSNLLYYPNSTYENIMPSCDSATASVATTTASMVNSNAVVVSTSPTLTSVITGSSTSTSNKYSPSDSRNLPPSHIFTNTSPTLAWSTNSALIPGENGVPGCAYIMASDMGPSPACSIDYCDCGGTTAPLLFSMLGSTQVTNCDYKTQPTVNSCPTLVAVSEGVLSLEPEPGLQTIVEGIVYIQPIGVCTTTLGGGMTCPHTYTTYTSLSSTIVTITLK